MFEEAKEKTALMVDVQERIQSNLEKHQKITNGINFNPTAEIEIQDLVFEKIVRFGGSGGCVFPERKYKIFSFKFGSGNKDDFLITNPDIDIPKGFHELNIKPYNDIEDLREKIQDFKQENFIKASKVFGYDKEKSGELSFEDFLITKHKEFPRFYSLANAINSKDFKNIKLDLSTLGYLLTGNIELDHKLVLYALMNFPEVEKRKLEPFEVMPYNPHGIYLTLTKTGKTTTFGKVGDIVESATASNLLGFGTADKRHIGFLNNKTESVSIDEITEEKSSDSKDKLATFLERGEIKISKGIGTNCKGWSTVNILGNIKSEENDKFENINEFKSVIERYISNFEALGSRLGLLVYDYGIKSRTGRMLNSRFEKENRLILKELKESLRKPFTSIINNDYIQDWLNLEHDTEYIDKLQSLRGKADDEDLRIFLKSHIQSNNHVRGGALRLAVMHNLKDVLSFEEQNHKFPQNTIMALLKDAKEFYELIKDQNLRSIENIISDYSLIDTDELHIQKLENEKDYIKYFLFNVFDLALEYEEELLPFSLLEANYINIKKKLKLDKNKDMYHTFKRVLKQIMKSKAKNLAIFEKYGLKYFSTPLEALKVSNPVLFSKYKMYWDDNKLGDKGDKGDTEIIRDKGDTIQLKDTKKEIKKEKDTHKSDIPLSLISPQTQETPKNKEFSKIDETIDLHQAIKEIMPLMKKTNKNDRLKIGDLLRAYPKNLHLDIHSWLMSKYKTNDDGEVWRP